MKRNRRSWKRFFLWIGAAALTVFALGGCAADAADAETGALPQDLEQLLSSAAAADGAVTVEELDAPRRYSERFSSEDGALTVQIDADVAVPAVKAIPILEVVPADFSQDTVSLLFERLCGTLGMGQDALLTDSDVTNRETGEVIAHRLRVDVSGEAGHFSAANNSDLGALIETESGEYYLPEFCAEIRFVRYVEHPNFSEHPARRVSDESAVPGEAAGSLTVTPAEARNAVDALLDGTGLSVSDVYLTDDAQFGFTDGIVSDAQNYAYLMQCSRTAEGVSCRWRYGGTQAADESGRVCGTWAYEYCSVVYGNDGVEFFEWRSPVEIGDIVVANTSLLPFDKIMDVFHSMIAAAGQMENADDTAKDEGLYEHGEIYIDKIVLTYQRINEAGCCSGGYLVPAWQFFGRELYDLDPGSDELIETGNVPPDAILTINAVDGSVIGRRQGY